MSDKPSPFETLAQDVQAKRRDRLQAEQKLQASREKVLLLWQPHLIELLDEAARQVAFIQVNFGDFKLTKSNISPVDLSWHVFGLGRNATLHIRVENPSNATVFLNGNTPREVVSITDDFPKDEFARAISSVLRAALV